MSNELENKLRWFSRNLDFLLEDLHSKESRQDGTSGIALYFDTFDVIEAVCGFNYYYAGADFEVRDTLALERDRPLRDRLLVLCLAFKGTLGEIKMLLPHQSEFLGKLTKRFDMPNLTTSPKELVRQFAKAVVEQEPIDTKEPFPGDGVSADRIFDYVRRHAGSARTIFKIQQLISNITWQSRLVKMRDSAILRLEEPKMDLGELIQTEEFQKLKSSFDYCRRDAPPVNNFADAVALTMLLWAIRDYQNGTGSPLPRFFVSSKRLGRKPLGWKPTFLKVIGHAKMDDDFCYESGNGKRYSVFREADYFVFRASAGPALNASSNPRASIFSDLAALQALQTDVTNLLLQKPSRITPEEVDKIIHSNYSLSQLINDLNNFLFFQNVWEPGSREAGEAFSVELTAAIEQLETEDFKKVVSQGIEDFEVELRDRVSGYEWVESLWEQIHRSTVVIRRYRANEDVDYFRDFGLLRFAFPESSHDRIRNVLEKLLYSGEEEIRTPPYDIIAACYWAGSVSKRVDVEIDKNELAAAVSVLWVGNKYSEITRLLDNIDPSPHFSFDIIYGAALFETNQNDERGVEILDKLEKHHSASVDSNEKAELAVGLAYLYFHLWRRRGHYALWDSPPESKQEKRPEGVDLINNAIRFAEYAYENLGAENRRKKVYALNQYLFYLVMGGGDEKEPIMKTLANDLINSRDSDRDSWQHRFDDTLAHHFHRLALLATDADDRLTYLKSAITHSELACERANWDRSVCDYSSKLKNMLSKT